MIKSIDTTRYKIRYSDQGAGSVCVLLHGYLESIDTFDAITSELSKRARVICIDLPGHGKSVFKQENVSIDDMADAVNTVIQHLNVDNVHMLGHSMGGYVALAYADKYADKLASFSFLHSTANADSEEKRANRVREIELIRKDKKELICGTAVPNTFSKKNQKAFAEEIEELT